MTERTALTRFQRILVGTDGTVTHLLEAYTGEPIEVVKLHQGNGPCGAAAAWLDLDPDGPVLRRNVVLRGRNSQQRLLYAEALVVPERLAAPVLDGLLGTDKPIGTLLAENRTETFREILTVDYEEAGECAPHLGLDPTTPLIFRPYRIVADGRPIMLITEKFPASSFRGLPG